ncbi:MAG: ion channel [Pseudomonadota bacterium]
MPLILQTLMGAGILLGCTLLHIVVLVGCIPVLRRLGQRYLGHPLLRTFTILSAAVMFVLLGHTLQIWTWTWLLLRMGEFEDPSTGLYFTTVTYTTLGYGDVVLDAPNRLMATFSAITGLVTFGISTAFVVGVLSRVLPEFFALDEPKD